MCGIAGLIDPNISNTEQVIGDMVASIEHRGPDEDGFFVDGQVGLGMRRLSIIDLSAGKQPITSADGKTLIFFNGEIYNYKELREELLGLGYVFKTHTDTETILHGYAEWGASVLPKLRGMFAFCIYNTDTKKIFLARDFFGIKPLYYWKPATTKSQTSGTTHVSAFGSEIKSFLKIPGFVPVVNDSAVYNYLTFQYNPLDETFFQDVYKLPPAHWMEIDLRTGNHTIEKYWKFAFNVSPRQRLGEEEMSKTVFDTLQDSVEHHMIADVPVGAFLSGGVDSSIIATLMSSSASSSSHATAGRSKNQIKTFTVGFEGLSEGKESKETSDALGTDHTEITVSSKEYFDVLPKAVWHFDEPVADPSAIGLYFVAREARKHVTVVLSGEGADELFGGYNIYLAPIASKWISWLPRRCLGALSWVLDVVPVEFWGKNYIRRASERLEEWYIGNASIFKQSEINRLWKPGPEVKMDAIQKYSLAQLYENARSNDREVSDSTKMQYIDIHTWLVGDILAKADKMTMANSLELRVPFLDIKVANLARTLPDEYKWKNGTTKYLLRKAFSGIIPETTRNRKKLGFPTSLRNWLRNEDTSRQVLETITKNSYIQSHFDTAEIKKLISDHVENKADNSRKIYLLLMLALWHNAFIEIPYQG